MTTGVLSGHDYEEFSFINYAGKNIMIQTSVLPISLTPQDKRMCASPKLPPLEDAQSTPITPTISFKSLFANTTA